jgi:hypothetical protein
LATVELYLEEKPMRVPHVDDLVRLTRDIPELELSAGDLGIVRSTWCSPYLAFEVEFRPVGQAFETRCLLAAEQVQVQDETGKTAGDA